MRRETPGATSAEQSVAGHPIGMEHGTEIMTLKGICPVEKLMSGDMIITHKGAIPLISLNSAFNGGYILEFDEPQIVLLDRGYINSTTGLPFSE